MGTVTLLAGMAVFFGVHSVSIVAPAWRDRMVARLGEPAWKGVYAIASVVGFILMIRGYSHAKLDPTVVYEPAYWLRHLAAIVMVPVFPLLLSTYFPGRIKAAAQHPMLAATKLWAAAHLLANGMLPDVLLFGGFLAWAIADRISLKPRQGAARAALQRPGRGGRRFGALCLVHRLGALPPVRRLPRNRLTRNPGPRPASRTTWQAKRQQ
jgi:uncharacterized membrane protein